MRIIKKEWGNLYEVDVLILGTGASGVGAALQAAKQGSDVLMVGKGKLESSGSLGGGNDHFMAALDTGEPYESAGEPPQVIEEYKLECLALWKLPHQLPERRRPL
jgi:succinate dehydrogenase/fumarate reductase flavoprotein subunit